MRIKLRKGTCKPKIFPIKFLATSCADKTPKEFCIDKPMKWPSGDRANFKFHEETEAILNEQINMELKTFYHYLSMVIQKINIFILSYLVLFKYI